MHQSACASQRGALTHSWLNDFVVATQGIPVHCLALVAMGASVPGFHGTVTIRETALGRPPQIADWNNLCLSVKEAYLFVLKFWTMEQVSGTPHILRLPEVVSEHTSHRMPSLCSSPASLQLLSISRKELIHSSGALSFKTVIQETHLDCIIWKPTGFLIAFTFFKSCFLRLWLPVIIKLGADSDPTLWDKSWHAFNNWKTLKLK